MNGHDAPVKAALPTGLRIAGWTIFLLAGALTAIFEVLLVPTRWGSTLIPIAPVLALLTNIALPALSRGLTDTMISAVPPVVGWIVVVFLLGSGPPGSDVLLPGGGTAWVSYLLLLCGALAGLATIGFAGRSGPWTGRGLLARWPVGRRSGGEVKAGTGPTGSDSGGAR